MDSLQYRGWGCASTSWVQLVALQLQLPLSQGDTRPDTIQDINQPWLIHFKTEYLWTLRLLRIVLYAQTEQHSAVRSFCIQFVDCYRAAKPDTTKHDATAACNTFDTADPFLRPDFSGRCKWLRRHQHIGTRRLPVEHENSLFQNWQCAIYLDSARFRKRYECPHR